MVEVHGKTLEKMEKELIGNEIITKFEITDPLKSEEKSLEKINKWLESINI